MIQFILETLWQCIKGIFIYNINEGLPTYKSPPPPPPLKQKNNADK